MISNRKLRILDLKRSDLVLGDDQETDAYIPPPDLCVQSSSHLVYTLPWPLQKKIVFLLCLKHQSTPATGGAAGAVRRVELTEDLLGIVFSYLRIPMYRVINIR
jgi:hypothetical protein